MVLERDKVRLEPYKEVWAEWFEEEARRLRAVFGEQAPIEHIGSTAIPGMTAKPIIDMMVGVESLGTVNQAMTAELENTGYRSMPDRVTKDEIFIPKGLTAAGHTTCTLRPEATCAGTILCCFAIIYARIRRLGKNTLTSSGSLRSCILMIVPAILMQKRVLLQILCDVRHNSCRYRIRAVYWAPYVRHREDCAPS
jgi:hypothetical protein